MNNWAGPMLDLAHGVKLASEAAREGKLIEADAILAQLGKAIANCRYELVKERRRREWMETRTAARDAYDQTDLDSARLST